MTASVDEVEWKYDLPPGCALPPLDGVDGVAGVEAAADEHLDAEYFDTGDLRLIRAGVTLRRRSGGRDAGWHLKLPTGPGSRREIQLPLDGDSAAIPGELRSLVCVYARREPLEPVVHMVTTRKVTVLLGSDGQELAEVATDEVRSQAAGSRGGKRHWREVEVELKGGDVSMLRRVDKVLRKAGLGKSGRAAKLERALSLELVSAAGAAELTPRSPAGQVVQSYLRDQVAAMTRLDPLVRRDEPDSVHQMRVTTRRLRSTLRTFSKLLPASAAEVSAELKWLGGVLGTARDAEVLAGHLYATVDQLPAELVLGPVTARLTGYFAPQRAAARAEVLTALDSGRYLDLLDALDSLTSGELTSRAAARKAKSVLPKAVRRPYRQVGKRMARASAASDATVRDSALHQARKAAKRARFGAEVASVVLGSDARKFRRRMKALQSVLGDHQDTVIARLAIRQIAVGASEAGENAFSYGLAYQLDAGAAATLRSRAARTWRDASRRRYRRWLG